MEMGIWCLAITGLQKNNNICIHFTKVCQNMQKMIVTICQKISNEKNNYQALLGQQWTFLFENGTCVRRTRQKIYMYISCRMSIVKYTISNVVLSYFYLSFDILLLSSFVFPSMLA
jgi:hypothetical protein